ncbi:MAG TPA: PH domain-containing protein [Flavobacterium sp.]
MAEFTNETIDVAALPRFEEVIFTPLHPDYWKVTLISLMIVLAVAAAGLAASILLIEDVSTRSAEAIIAVVVLFALIFFFSRISFRKKGYAFREHDVLFRSGIIATNTIIIPYNRVQHVALHEGLLSRSFGLAEIQIFTAGGSSSDIGIPGIKKEQAENIKQLLMGKIQKQL